jgi:hypothetical protein
MICPACRFRVPRLGAAGGGGTVVPSGSHRLVNAHIAATGIWRPTAVRAALASAHPWLRDLWGHGRDAERVACLMTDGVVIDGTRVRVRELTGRAEEVVLMHPRTLHAPAPNTHPTLG